MHCLFDFFNGPSAHNWLECVRHKFQFRLFSGAFQFQFLASGLLRLNLAPGYKLPWKLANNCARRTRPGAAPDNCGFDPIFNFTTAGAGAKTITICCCTRSPESILLCSRVAEDEVENPEICQTCRAGRWKIHGEGNIPTCQGDIKVLFYSSRCHCFAFRGSQQHSPSLIVLSIHLAPYYSGWPVANMQHHLNHDCSLLLFLLPLI